MAKIIKEQFNGGLVQTRHPTLLKPGEVQQADDTILRPGDPAIHKAPGRTDYSSVSVRSFVTITDGSTNLQSQSAGAFGTAVLSVSISKGANTMTAASGLSALDAGQSIIITSGSGIIPAGTFINAVISDTQIELSELATAGGTGVVVGSDFHPGTFVTGTGIPDDTTIVEVAGASSVTLSASATDSTTTSRTFTESVCGLNALVFDRGFDDILLAKTGDQLYSSPLTSAADPPTGTFIEAAAGLSHGADSILNSVQYKNRYAVLTGEDKPKVVYYTDIESDTSQQITVRTLGMEPVTSFASVTVVDGSWSAQESLQDGWYYFLVTEVLILGEEEIESTYTGETKPVHITDYANQGVQITYRASSDSPANDGLRGRNLATHWRVYMSPKEPDKLPTPDLASFAKQATVPIGTNTFTLEDGNPYQTGFAKDIVPYGSPAWDTLIPDPTASALTQTAAQTATATTGVDSTRLTSSAAFGSVLAGMSVVSTTVGNIPYGAVVTNVIDSSTIDISEPAVALKTEVVGFGNSDPTDGSMALSPPNPNNGADVRASLFQNFGFQDIGGFSTGVITGIEVEIQGRSTNSGDFNANHVLHVSLNDGGSAGTFTDEQSGTFGQVIGHGSTTRKSSGILKLGENFDTWGHTWAPSDFVNGGPFGVAIRKAAGTEVTHEIDSIKVTVYAGGTNLNVDGERFATVVIAPQVGDAFASGAAGPPPIASTGDIFEGMLVLNNVEDDSTLVASLPDREEMFPDIYRLPIETKKNDKITFIRSLNNICIIGCQDSIKRLNYFPRENNAEFVQGRAYEDVASDHGIVGPLAAQLIDLPRRGTILAYLSHNGLHWTDGITTTFLNDDIDWENLIEPTLIHRSVMEVYSRLSMIALYYVPVGGTDITKALYLSYHPTHIKEGMRLPATGPINVKAKAATSTTLNGKNYLFTGHTTTGKVYVEDSGTLDEGGDFIYPVIHTRRIFTSDVGHTGRVERVVCMTDADGDATTGVFALSFMYQNSGEAYAFGASEGPSTEIGGLVKTFVGREAETFDVQIGKGGTQTAAFRLHYMAFEVNPMGPDTN